MPHVSLWIRPLVLVLALGGSVRLAGQDARPATPAGASEADREAHRSAVVIDGEPLFSVRGVTAYPAEQRAAEIAARIRAVAADPKIVAASLTLEEAPNRTWIVADGRRIMAVLDEDAGLEQVARGTLAELYRTRIGRAIEEYRSDRRAGFLWSRALYTLVATVVLVVVSLVGRRLVVVVGAALERRYHVRVQGLESRALHVVKVEQVWRALMGFLHLAWGLAIAVMVYAYLNYVLALFPWTRGFAKSLLAIAIDPLRVMGLGLLGMIPNFVFLAILILFTRYALKMLKMLFDGLAAGTVAMKGFDPDWAWPTYRLVRILVVVFAIVVAYPYIPGSGSEAFKGVSLFMGVIFSLGSSSLIGNFIAGYSMTYRRAFRVGDRVKIGDQVGIVERTRLMVTHLRTVKNEEVVVPNSSILSNDVVNYSSLAREQGLILHTTVGIGYETPWRQVEAMLVEAAARTPGLRSEPAPFVLKKELGDFCVTYEINVFCDRPEQMEALYTDLHGNILDIFNEYGVQIMTPAYEGDPEQPKVVPKEDWFMAPARGPHITAGAR